MTIPSSCSLRASLKNHANPLSNVAGKNSLVSRCSCISPKELIFHASYYLSCQNLIGLDKLPTYILMYLWYTLLGIRLRQLWNDLPVMYIFVCSESLKILLYPASLLNSNILSFSCVMDVITRNSTCVIWKRGLRCVRSAFRSLTPRPQLPLPVSLTTNHNNMRKDHVLRRWLSPDEIGNRTLSNF